VLVPTEEVIEVRRGKKVTERAPLHARLRAGPHGDEQPTHYHLINSINRVTGFLGPQGKPSRCATTRSTGSSTASRKARAPRNLIHFEIGEQVKVNRRPVRGLLGHGRGSRRGQQPA
jgi:transcription termination/antitermination protein NusG